VEDIQHQQKKHEDETTCGLPKTCIEEDIIPKGLTVELTSTLEDKDNEIFNNKSKQI